jgi:hypothetical protein
VPESADVDASDKPDGIARRGHRVMLADAARVVV